MSQPQYRWRHNELKRLRNIPRYIRAETQLLGNSFEMVDTASFLSIYHELFEREIYRFQTNHKKPFIIDGGANIGLSILYFKKLYPDCSIVAFEPDPQIFQVLTKNCNTFGFKDVELIPNALWNTETTLSFIQEGGEAGRLATSGEANCIIDVQTCRLMDFLEKVDQVSLLKLDIEGAETAVLLDCAERLSIVERLFIEYHSFVDKPQTLHQLISTLQSKGFRIHMHSLLPSPQPFIKCNVNFGMDFQSNIFAYRPDLVLT